MKKNPLKEKNKFLQAFQQAIQNPTLTNAKS